MQRQTTLDQRAESGDMQSSLPPSLLRRYELHFHTFHKGKTLALRQVKASDIGKLVKISGIVTRVSEVRYGEIENG